MEWRKLKSTKSPMAEGGIKAVAKVLNLSASTVSRALNGVYGVNEATRKLVQETARAMGYVPHLGAKQLVGKSSNMIGVFIPQFEFEASSGYVDMFSPLQLALQSHGKDALFFSIPFLQYPKDRLTECIGSRSLEGCLIFPAFSRSHPIMQEALGLNLPCVNFENVVGPRCSSVVSDDREGGRMVGRKLAEKGHRVIGFLSGPPQIRICKDRYEGFCEGLSEAGIAHDPSLVAIGDFSGSSGADLAIRLRNAHPGMTALFCANDLMAMGAMMAFAKSGISVPDQVSIVGYDGDHFTPYTSPPMTTIKHSREEVSSIAVKLLMELLEGNPGRGTSVPPQLIMRQSLIGLD